MKNPKWTLHQLYKRRFGGFANERSHSWLREHFGKCHVAELTTQEVVRAVSKLQGVVNHSAHVRAQTWERLERERRR